MTKRVIDFLMAAVLLGIFAIPMLIVAAVIKLTSPGPIFYWADRVGQDNKLFSMPKFRSMRTDTPEVATHLLNDTDRWITPIGKFIRKTSLDELPQLLMILSGKMSFVGPRPALHNQYDLNELRTFFGVHKLKPGITGLAVIKGRDEHYTEEKVEFDRQYLQQQSLAFDFKIMLATFFKITKRDGIKDSDKDIEEPFLLIREGADLAIIATPDLLNASITAFADQGHRIISIRRSALGESEHLRLASGSSKQVFLVLRASDANGSEVNRQALEAALPDHDLTIFEVPNREETHMAVAEDGQWIRNYCDSNSLSSTTNRLAKPA